MGRFRAVWWSAAAADSAGLFHSRAQKAPKDESKGEDGGDEEPRNAEKAAKAQSKSGSIAAAFAKQVSRRRCGAGSISAAASATLLCI